MRKLRLLNTSEYLTEQVLLKALEGTGYRVHAPLPLHRVVQREPGEIIPQRDKKYLQTSELDFVVYNPESYPEFAVEFDGPIHQEAEQRRKDVRKNRICEMAGLPLVRITDIHLEEYEKCSLLEYMIRRFVAWKAEEDEVLAEINEYLATLSEEEFRRLTQDGFLDPTIDPSVIFDLRHPFPGTAELAERLYAQYGILSDHLESEAWTSEARQDRRLEFATLGGGFTSQGSDHIQRGNYELVEITPKAQEPPSVERVHSVHVEFRIQWTVPVVEDFDWRETPFEYYRKTGRTPIAFQDIPGISMPELAENFCEFLALKKLCDWAEQNLPAKHTNAHE